MSFLKRIFGTVLNGHHGSYRNSHRGQKNHDTINSPNNEAQRIRCPQCQNYNAPGARFCSQCGQGIQNTLCACGALVAAGAKFCGQCGKLL